MDIDVGLGQFLEEIINFLLYILQTIIDQILKLINAIISPFVGLLGSITALFDSVYSFVSSLFSLFLPSLWVAIMLLMLFIVVILRIYSFVKDISIGGFKI
ncbi:hypothetical protein V7O62_09890 [Methanolobus sp. ZRKC2]|uniref:hypothetical protein n=1 Tax=Methanolobus sp. ZRKC2 TaxID=3125783 RepID=UPI00324A7EA6